ncbi:MAG: hypothetical protein OEY51_09585 [Cyclobacteriaceae bacterium]|nr:hypothetical protein [Cyclobacteriaceae bacterium]
MNKSDFEYFEQIGVMFYGKGRWQITDKGSRMILESDSLKETRNDSIPILVPSIFKEVSGVVKIISKRKIKYEGNTLILQDNLD